MNINSDLDILILSILQNRLFVFICSMGEELKSASGNLRNSPKTFGQFGNYPVIKNFTNKNECMNNKLFSF